MSAPEKLDLARGWRRAEELLEEEADRIASMSDEEFEREAAALPEPSRIPTAEELRVRGAELAGNESSRKAKPAPMIRPLPRRKSVLWLVAAALCVVVILLVVKREEVIAWFRPQAPPPQPTQKPEDSILVRQERADALRREAFAACAQRSWTLCEAELNEAKTLDPKGEDQMDVLVARGQIYVARHPGDGATRLLPDTKEWDAGQPVRPHTK